MKDWTFQLKDKDNSPEKTKNETDLSNLTDLELKQKVIKILKELRKVTKWLSGKESTCQCRRWDYITGSGRDPGGESSSHSSILAWKIPWTQELGGL